VAWFGYDAFLVDPAWLNIMAPFALTQLQWVLSMAKASQNLSMIPDWFVKEPARWLAYMARRVPASLPTHQADAAIDVVTQLLDVGSDSDSSSMLFSPLVLTELIHVASAFVNSGIKRTQKYSRRRHGGGSTSEDDHESKDDEDLDDPNIYTSLDKSNLGIAVFANQRVGNELCPTLLKTFQAVDHIEGLNVDSEASFDKFSVKVEIARLIIRLWNHPNGECRESISRLHPGEISAFASSMSAAIGLLLDDACQRYSDVVKLQRRPTSAWVRQERRLYEKQSRGAASNFLSGRILLTLLIRLSKENNIAKAIGEGQCAKEMAQCVVHFLELLTSEDGGVNPDIDVLVEGEKTLSTFQTTQTLSSDVKLKLATKLVESRKKTSQIFGLDVSQLAHAFLALATRWFKASQVDSEHVSALVSCLASLDDCNISKYRAVADRMIPSIEDEADIVTAVLKRDGYATWDLFTVDQSRSALSETEHKIYHYARKCRLSHDEISSLASRGQIQELLREVERKKMANSEPMEMPVQDVRRALEKVMKKTCNSSANDYGESLRHYTVSSEEFKLEGTDRFAHFFDKMARGQTSLVSGKILEKEARRSFKILPLPHPNASSFICFDEDLMTLSKAVIIGPVDTPYASGAFFFDVFFPSYFPQVPPLVQFMTTGGGQFRFGPNLYSGTCRQGKSSEIFAGEHVTHVSGFPMNR
jgi:hypothetical protein